MAKKSRGTSLATYQHGPTSRKRHSDISLLKVGHDFKQVTHARKPIKPIIEPREELKKRYSWIPQDLRRSVDRRLAAQVTIKHAEALGSSHHPLLISVANLIHSHPKEKGHAVHSFVECHQSDNMSTRPHLRPYVAHRPPIFRVKTGCFTCRGRKKKCDEVKPLCSGCKRNKLNCRWPTSAQCTRRPHIPNKRIPQQESTSRAGTPSPDIIFCVDTGQKSPMPPAGNAEDGATDVAMTTIIVGYGLPPDTSSHSNSHDSPSMPLTDFQSTCLPTVLPNMLPPDNDNGEDASNAEAPGGLGEAQAAAALLVPAHASSIPRTVSPFPCQDTHCSRPQRETPIV
ncbi:hypothetical protein EDB80DRAFT_805846 [Ilyonectria destructans]|nr:hypothetical protein EDB80DRAFT_805846 [Ilyonectria destructans]